MSGKWWWRAALGAAVGTAILLVVAMASNEIRRNRWRGAVAGGVVVLVFVPVHIVALLCAASSRLGRLGHRTSLAATFAVSALVLFLAVVFFNGVHFMQPLDFSPSIQWR